MAITSANQLELLQTAEAVAREKMIDPDLVIEAMEDSLARAAKSRYGSEMDIRVHIDRKTGNASFTRARTCGNFSASKGGNCSCKALRCAIPSVSKINCETLGWGKTWSSGK